MYPGVGERSISKNLPTITQDLSRRSIATSGESVSMYPRRSKAEAFSNAVDVVERLRDPTDPSTQRTTSRRSAHVQLSDVPRTLDPVEAEGEFRQHDGCRCQNRWISGRGSRTVRLRSMVTGDGGH